METIIITKENNRYDLGMLENYFKCALDGRYKIDVTLVRKKRTLDQNGWLWGCIYPLMLKALNDAGWEFTTIEQVHDFLKSQFCGQKMINKHTGEIVSLPMSTALMDTLAFSEYVEKIREYAYEYLGCDIPDPVKPFDNYE